MTDQQIQSKVDNWFGPQKLAAIQQKQDDFLALWAKYFQGIATPVTYPVDGADSDADLTLHPTDQPQDWANFLGAVNLGKFPCSVSITFHDGPDGRGFTIDLRYTNAQGQNWIRLQGVGPYGVTAPWRLLPSPRG